MPKYIPKVTHCPKCHSMNIFADADSEIACDDCGYEVLRSKVDK